MNFKQQLKLVKLKRLQRKYHHIQGEEPELSPCCTRGRQFRFPTLWKNRWAHYKTTFNIFSIFFMFRSRIKLNSWSLSLKSSWVKHKGIYLMLRLENKPDFLSRFQIKISDNLHIFKNPRRSYKIVRLWNLMPGSIISLQYVFHNENLPKYRISRD